jgi:hypothetical protein
LTPRSKCPGTFSVQQVSRRRRNAFPNKLWLGFKACTAGAEAPWRMFQSLPLNSMHDQRMDRA